MKSKKLLSDFDEDQVFVSSFIIGCTQKDPDKVIEEFIKGMRQNGKLVISCKALPAKQEDVRLFSESSDFVPIKENLFYYYMESDRKMYMFKIDSEIHQDTVH